jgi:hypothetical protein
MKRFAFFFLLLIAMLGFASPVLANDNLPPFVTTTDVGWTTLDTSQLVETGTVEVPPPDGVPYMQFNIPGTEIQACIGCMTYNTYTDTSGEYTIIAPDAYTATVMAATGSGPFSQEPVYAQTSDGLTAMLVLSGGYENMGISNQEAVDGWLTTVWNVWTLNPGEGTQTSLASDPFMLISLMWANATGDGPNQFVFTSGYFVYQNDDGITGLCQSAACHSRPSFRPNRNGPLATISPIPTLRPTLIPTPSITNLTVDCPLDPSVAQDDPANTVRANKIAPNNPVVVGQDPEKTGVTLSVSMTVPPVYYSYNVKNYHTRCEGSGCGQPPGYGPVNIINWETCDRVTEVYADYLASITISANLSQASIDWITGELAQRYPGAQVYQPNWALFPGLPGVGGGIGTAAFSMQWNRLQFRDPGKYLVNVTGATTGTPVSPPRSFAWNQETFSVNLIETALIK